MYDERDDHSSPVVSAAKVGLIWGLLKGLIHKRGGGALFCLGMDDEPVTVTKNGIDLFLCLHQFLKGLKGEIFFIFFVLLPAIQQTVTNGTGLEGNGNVFHHTYACYHPQRKLMTKWKEILLLDYHHLITGFVNKDNLLYCTV